ncbi:MAG: SDR family oxidoreductase, partial [Alphaproteobacteria bacterium]|nr:SDR family oxidoreductase [Alphaproteobacteria bacterium]
QVYAVNVRGLVLCIKHAIPLLKRRGGSIINMASRVGIRPNPLRSAYGSSKFAVRGITECVSQEVGAHGIRVNALCPGAVDTELFRSIARERAAAEGRDVETYIDAAYRRAATLRRLVSLDDVAGTALFLASDASAAITGESIKVDAGRS